MANVDNVVKKILEGNSVRAILAFEAKQSDVYKIISDVVVDFIKSLDGESEDDWYVQAYGYSVPQFLKVNSVKPVGKASDLNFEIDAEFEVDETDVCNTDDWNEASAEYNDGDGYEDAMEFAHDMGWCGRISSEIFVDTYSDALKDAIEDALDKAGLTNTVAVKDIVSTDFETLHIECGASEIKNEPEVTDEPKAKAKSKGKGGCTFNFYGFECYTDDFKVKVGGKSYLVDWNTKPIPCKPGDNIVINTGVNDNCDYTQCYVMGPADNITGTDRDDKNITHLSFAVPNDAKGAGVIYLECEPCGAGDDLENYYIGFSFDEFPDEDTWCKDVNLSTVKVY